MEAVRSPVPHHQVNVYTHTHLHVVPGARTLHPPRVQQQPGPLRRSPDDSREGPRQKQLPALAPRGSRGCSTTEL